MSDESNNVSRRNVLKKGGAAATVAAGGLAATSGSAAALDWRYLLVQGQGSFQIEVYADNVEVTDNGVDGTLDVEQATDSSGNSFYILSGEVYGEINSTPNDYAQFKIYGHQKFDDRTWESGVDVYWKTDELSQS
ncbi:hypothetical protein [Halorussus pelagicus]|uniref:hypothetical protein n=1 Tax=Halorussus pelagicus TaxID=2505977 RepID=UPI000FFCB728|nr:hypothetical protein [Halorussus pelagicus]